MGTRLKDIIDLEYFIHLDDALDSREDINARAMRDRTFCAQCKDRSKTGKTLLLYWLSSRREEFFRTPGKKKVVLLPGTVFSFLYTWMVYAAVIIGGFSGICLSYSFLAYHGTRPINVAVFIAAFVFLQLILILFTLLFLLRRFFSSKNRAIRFRTSILQALFSAFFLNVLPGILKKITPRIFKKSRDTLEYTTALIRMKQREYKDLFFWPFFIIASLFSFSFSLGALGGTFFRVVISDMAFGWQSTLMATSTRVYDMIAFMARPWSWFVPQTLAHPSLEQIEGSRIVLKDGISVLATQDLVSWWPFLCLSLLFYAVIPRGLLVLTGLFARHRVLARFNFEKPRFRQVIVRMQSPVLDIDTSKTPPGTVDPSVTDRINAPPLFVRPEPVLSGEKAVILASKRVYTDAIIKKIFLQLQPRLFFDVTERIEIHFDAEKDKTIIQRLKTSAADPVILLHEVWQPPIRGVLHYITQVKAALPEGSPLYILLTRNTDEKDLSVAPDNLDFQIWKKAIIKLKDPDIIVERVA